MATLLLIIIYISYIGLGIPDSLFGAAWPVIYREFGLPVSANACVTLLISISTVVSSFASAKVIRAFGSAKVGAVSTVLTALALFGFSCAPSLVWLCICAVPLGLGAGAIDVTMNNYVALHYNAVQMNFLHCFYGVGVSLSPYLMSLALADGSRWRNGYRSVFYAQAAIAIIMIIAIPLWKKVGESEEGEPVKERVVSYRELLKNPAVRSNVGVFMGSCAVESVCLAWGATFFADGKGMEPERAAKMIALYYIGMTLGRFVSGILANKLSSRTLVYLGQGITGAAIVLLLLPLPAEFSVAALVLIGFGNGAVFPNMTHLTPINFGKEISQSVISFQMALTYLSILFSPPLFGIIAQFIGVTTFPWYILLMFIIMLSQTVLLAHRLKKRDTMLLKGADNA